jgi:hypothetical protein
MKRALVLMMVALLGFATCEAQSKTKAKTKKTKQGRITWRLMVDFISKGSGIDTKTYDALISYAATHPKKPIYNVIEKGREGEKQVYFGLAELSEDEQYAFVDDVQRMLPDNKMVKMETTLPKRKAIPGLTTATDASGGAGAKYRLQVSFISKGGGIEAKTHDKFVNYVENHPKKPAFEAKSWGREGEKDYLLTLKELNADEQKVFVEEVKKLISNSDMVFVKENEAYNGRGK